MGVPAKLITDVINKTNMISMSVAIVLHQKPTLGKSIAVALSIWLNDVPGATEFTGLTELELL